MDRSEQVSNILADWIDQHSRGEAPPPEELLRQHPGLEAQLREGLAAVGMLELELGFALDPASDAPAMHAAEVIGDYRIVRELGRGGMGVVYEAEQVSMDRRVALKVLTPSLTGAGRSVKRFQREAQSAGRLHHTHIVPVFQLGEDRGHWFYAMELVRGPTVSAIVAELQRAPAHPTESGSTAFGTATGSSPEPPSAGTPAGAGYYRRVAEVFAGVVDALQTAHDAGIVHRDVKPSNLMLDEDGNLKIVDFGLAHLDQPGPSMTLSGDLVGTPSYMSPEQAAARGVALDHRTDIYSLGATLYEVLTLRPPFDGASLQEVCSQIASQDPAFPRRVDPRIPRDLETIVLKAMEKDRDKRYQRASELADDLRRFAQGAVIGARRVGITERAWRKVKRHRAVSGLVAGLLVCTIAGGVLARRAWREADLRRDSDYGVLLIKAGGVLPASLAEVGSGALDDEASGGGDTTTLLTRAIGLRPARPEAYWLRALVPGRSSADRAADLAAAGARGLDPETVELLSRYVATLDAPAGGSADPELAVGEPENAVACYAKARLLVHRFAYGRALPLLDRAMAQSGPGTMLRLLALQTRAHAWEAIQQPLRALEDRLTLRGLGDLSEDNQLRIAELYLKTEQPEAARRLLEEVLPTLPKDTVEGLRGRGRALRQLGDLEGALTACADALELDASRDIVHQVGHLRAQIHELRGDHEACLAAWNEAIESRDCAEARLARAKLLRELGRREPALRDLRQAAALAPEYAYLWFVVGREFDRLGCPTDAIAAYEQAVAHGAEHGFARRAAHNNLGNFLLQRGDLAGAEEHYRAALEGGGDNPNPHFNLGRVRWRQGRLADAEQHLRDAIELDPDYWKPRTMLGRLLAQQRRPEAEEVFLAGVECFDRQLADAPRDVVLLYNKGVTLRLLDRFAEAEAAYEAVLAVDPTHAGAWNNLGSLRYRRSDYAGARDAFRESLALRPSDPAVRMNLGRALHQLRDHAELSRVLEPLTDARGDDLELWRYLFDAYWAQPDSAEARQRAFECAGELVRLRPGDPGSWDVRAQAAEALNLPDEAQRARQEMLALGSADARGHRRRAARLFRHGRLRKALAAADRARQLDPDHLQTLRFRATLLHMLGRLDEELDCYRTILARDPACQSSARNLSYNLHHLGRHEQALVAIEEGLAARPEDPELLAARGACLLAMRRYLEAQAAFGRAVQAAPDDAAAQAGLEVADGALARRETLQPILAGDRDPGDVDELAVAVKLARIEDLPARATELWELFLEASPKSARREQTRRSWEPAATAMRAASGLGDGADLDDEARSTLRGKALVWLRASLARHGEATTSGSRSEGNQARMQLGTWLALPDLAPVREPRLLASLPDDEHEAWSELWRELRATVDPSR